jgi:hypothetical protein
MKALAARRLALRRLDCLRFGLAMEVRVGNEGRHEKTPEFRVKGEGIKVGPEARQAP